MMTTVHEPANPHSGERVPKLVGVVQPEYLLRDDVVGLEPLAAVRRVRVNTAALIPF